SLIRVIRGLFEIRADVSSHYLCCHLPLLQTRYNESLSPRVESEDDHGDRLQSPGHPSGFLSRGGRIMKKNCWMALAGLAALTLASLATLAQAQAPKADGYTFSGPYTYQNLTIFLVHGKDTLPAKKLLTLQEALEQKKLVVHETKQVGQLSVENIADDFDVFIQSGDIVKCGQQDRALGYDLIVSAKSGKVPIQSF